MRRRLDGAMMADERFGDAFAHFGSLRALVRSPIGLQLLGPSQSRTPLPISTQARVKVVQSSLQPLVQWHPFPLCF